MHGWVALATDGNTKHLGPQVCWRGVDSQVALATDGGRDGRVPLVAVETHYNPIPV